MRKLSGMIVTGGLLLTPMLLMLGPAWAGDTGKRVGHDTRHTGKTILRGTSGVGKGGSKVYHDVAGKFHKLVAKNSKSGRTRVKHLGKSDAHHRHATRKAVQSKREMDKAGKHANTVGK